MTDMQNVLNFTVLKWAVCIPSIAFVLREI